MAYIIFHCSSKELQARAGFDGWVTLLRDQFDTEDQAWPQERLRLASVAKRKMRRMESGGVELDMLQLVTSCHLLLDPPAEDREEERIWCIEFFPGKMYDFVVRAATTERARPAHAQFASRQFGAVRRPPFPSVLLPCCCLTAGPLPSDDFPPCTRHAHCPAHSPRAPLRQADDRELVQRLKRFQEELLHSARQATSRSPGVQRVRSDGSSTSSALEVSIASARPSGETAPSPVRPAAVGEDLDWASKAHEHESSGSGQRKPMSALALAAALELTDLESAQQRFGGGAFLPILPLGSDTDSIDRGLPTLPTSTARWPQSC